MSDNLLKYFEQQKELGFDSLYTNKNFSDISNDYCEKQASSQSLICYDNLKDIESTVKSCIKCRLSSTRNNTVFGEGNLSADLMFIGEAPGRDEDIQGRPFVGKAGKLLDKMIINGMQLKREDVYITNILKCRPPNNRDPKSDEQKACIDYLVQQIKIIKPSFICCLGRIAARVILGFDDTVSLKSMRGKIHDYMGINVCVTYHPSALLQHPGWKKNAWEDLKFLMMNMGIDIPKKYK